ncbi:MAG TPA: hypothetical protein VFA47_02930, partial [Candidatus Manganitrophaceae bacterium]|nr:hypothetical protein [Candidatus Manganitrophaceae bacterium]
MLSSRKTLSFAAKRPGIGRFLPFILILLVSSSSLLSAAEPAERIAAVVNGEIIFLSDLQRYRLFFEPPEKKTEAPADPMKTLEAIVNRRLLLKEARRFILEGPTEEETDQRLKRVRQRFKDEPAFLQALDQTGFSLEE